MPEDPTTPDLEEALRRSTEAFNRRDFDRALAVFTQDAVWDASPLGMGVFEGRETVQGLFEDVRWTYEDFEQVIEGFRDLGGVTFGVLRQRGRLPDSSGVVTADYGVVVTWRDDLIERLTAYLDIDEARAAAERLAEERR